MPYRYVYLTGKRTLGYNLLMKHISRIFNHPRKKEIERRMRIIRFSEEFGVKVAIKAFQIGRSTLFLWKKKLEDAQGDLIQLDSIVLFANGIKRYLITAIDLKTRFSFALAYQSLSSNKATDFIGKLSQVAPFKIKRVQTDNGSEFTKHFREYVQKHNIVHFHNYPRKPQSNAYVERFNRTVQEQHVNWRLRELFNDTARFNQGLMEYLLWYNTRKQHRSLNKTPPLKYYVDNFINCSLKSNMLWTLTGA